MTPVYPESRSHSLQATVRVSEPEPRSEPEHCLTPPTGRRRPARGHGPSDSDSDSTLMVVR
eukprot:575926-Rhodomonas_salina.2